VITFVHRFFKQFLVRKGLKNAKYIPEIMLCVLLGIFSAKGMRLDKAGVAILGDKIGEAGFPIPKWPHMSMTVVSELISDCLLMVIVGFVEATAVSKSLATKHNYTVSSNRELVAFGVANMLGSIFRAYPSFASIPRTSVQDMAGSRTCLTGFLVSWFMLITILFLTPLFYFLPLVSMAAIIFVAAFGLLEVHEAVFLWKTKSWTDLIQFTIALLATFILEVELGILISVGMCIFLVLKHSSAPHTYSVLGRIPYTQNYKDVSKFPDAERIPGILLIRVDEVLYFANISNFKQLLQDIEVRSDFSLSLSLSLCFCC
jgi:MFS superfamily sulfate permease-like transporter